MHDGHAYFLRQTKEISQADFTVVVMSGDFVQRGTPAVCDKFLRARMALASGADLVLELPHYYATGSAEFFATGAVSVLNALQCVDVLAFGSEAGDVDALQSVASLLISEPAPFQEALAAALKQGKSFPAAREIALNACADNVVGTMADVLAQNPDLLKSPNNILGIEYLKALQRTGSNMKAMTITRASGYASAETIRTELFGAENATAPVSMRRMNKALKHLPYAAKSLLLEAAGPDGDGLLNGNHFSQILQYKLATSVMLPSVDIVDLSQELWDRIRWTYSSSPYQSFDAFTEALKAKNNTYAGIQRALLHLILDVNNTSMRQYTRADNTEPSADASENGYVVYLRALGFKEDASPLLKAIKQNATQPLITKLADAERLLNDAGLSLLKENIAASRVYDVVRRKTERTEYEKQIVIV